MTSPRVRKIADRIQVIVAEMLERRIKDPRLGLRHHHRRPGHRRHPAGHDLLHRPRRGRAARRHGGGAGVGQGADPLRGRQAARDAARADPDVRPRRAARDGPPPRRGARQGARPRTRPWRPPASRRTPARPTRTRSPARSPRTTTSTTSRSSRPPRRPRRTRDRRLRGRPAWSSSTSRRADVARRRGAGPACPRHPQGRPRRHARPDGHRRARARRRPGHPAARPPDADREGLRRHRPARASPRPPTTPRARSSAPRPPATWPRTRSATRWRGSSATSSRCRRPSRRSRSTGGAPTSGCARARRSSWRRGP